MCFSGIWAILDHDSIPQLVLNSFNCELNDFRCYRVLVVCTDIVMFLVQYPFIFQKNNAHFFAWPKSTKRCTIWKLLSDDTFLRSKKFVPLPWDAFVNVILGQCDWLLAPVWISFKFVNATPIIMGFHIIFSSLWRFFVVQLISTRWRWRYCNIIGCIVEPRWSRRLKGRLKILQSHFPKPLISRLSSIWNEHD